VNAEVNLAANGTTIRVQFKEVTMKLRMLGLMTAVCATLAGCDKKESEEVVLSREEYVGRGTQACQDWQFAFCEYLFGDCNFSVNMTHTQCQTWLSTLSCIDDAAAAQCADDLASAPCTGIPEGCDEESMMDSTTTTALCEEWIGIICEKETGCGIWTDETECLEFYADGVLECEIIDGVYLNYEDCRDEFLTLSCNDSVPDDCVTLFVRY